MNLSRMPIAVPATAVAAALLAACGAGGGDASDASDASAARGATTTTTTTTTVVATTTQLGDLARAVAGDRAAVRQILQPNSDPHEYEPRPSDVEAVGDTAIVLRSGGEVDEWLGGVLRNAGSDARVVTLIDAVTARGGKGEPDPHWWQDPRNALVAVREIRDTLVDADPGGRARYTANAATFSTRLRALDRAIAACMRAIPAERRKLVTDHDALGYFAARYGIEVVGTVIPALSTQAQASAGEVARLVRTIRAERVRTIFPEDSVDAKLTRAIAADAGAEVGPPLYADTLGPKGSAGETYLGALRSNARALAAGFSGDAARCQL